MKFKPFLPRGNQREHKRALTLTAEFTCTQVLCVAEQMPSQSEKNSEDLQMRVSKTCTKQIFMVYKYTQAHSFSFLHRAETPTTVSCNMSDILTKQAEVVVFSLLHIARLCSLFLLL